MAYGFEGEVSSQMKKVDEEFNDYFEAMKLEESEAYPVEKAFGIGVLNFMGEYLSKSEDWFYTYHFSVNEVVKVFHLFSTLKKKCNYMNILEEIAVLRNATLQQFPPKDIPHYVRGSIALGYFLIRMMESANKKNTKEVIKMFEKYISSETLMITDNSRYEVFAKKQFEKSNLDNLLNRYNNSESVK